MKRHLRNALLALPPLLALASAACWSRSHRTRDRLGYRAETWLAALESEHGGLTLRLLHGSAPPPPLTPAAPAAPPIRRRRPPPGAAGGPRSPRTRDRRGSGAETWRAARESEKGGLTRRLTHGSDPPPPLPPEERAARSTSNYGILGIWSDYARF